MRACCPREIFLLCLACALVRTLLSAANAQETPVSSPRSSTPWDSRRATQQLKPADAKQVTNPSVLPNRADRSAPKSAVTPKSPASSKPNSSVIDGSPPPADLPIGGSRAGETATPADASPQKESPRATMPSNAPLKDVGGLDSRAGIAMFIGLVPLTMIGYGIYYMLFTRRGRLNPFGDMASGIGPPDERTLNLLETTLKRKSRRPRTDRPPPAPPPETLPPPPPLPEYRHRLRKKT